MFPFSAKALIFGVHLRVPFLTVFHFETLLAKVSDSLYTPVLRGGGLTSAGLPAHYHVMPFLAYAFLLEDHSTTVLPPFLSMPVTVTRAPLFQAVKNR